MATASITHTQGAGATAAAAITCPAGEDLTITITLLTSAGAARNCTGGTISFCWERRGGTGSPNRATIAGEADGIHVLTIDGDVTKYLDGAYVYDAWITDADDNNEQLRAQSQLTITRGIGPAGI